MGANVRIMSLSRHKYQAIVLSIDAPSSAGHLTLHNASGGTICWRCMQQSANSHAIQLGLALVYGHVMLLDAYMPLTATVVTKMPFSPGAVNASFSHFCQV
jgi:hypothetical protein